MDRIFPIIVENEQLESLFEDDARCLEFLARIKWGEGFRCRKCGHTNSCAGKGEHSRRCTRCKTEESATTGTIFHNCKFPISKAFYIAYHVCKSKQALSTYEFARRLQLRQMTCWKFKSKIKAALTQVNDLDEHEKMLILKALQQ